MAKKPDASGEMLAVIFAFLGVGLLLLMAVVLFRAVVPFILESRVYGSAFLATLAVFFGSAAIALVAHKLFSRIGKLFSK